MIDATAAERNEPVQMKVYKYLKLWSFYFDMEESLRTLGSTYMVYERILILQIAIPQIVLNYAYLLEVRSFSKSHGFKCISYTLKHMI
jgi:pre-mRNA-splicing factor SYF1